MSCLVLEKPPTLSHRTLVGNLVHTWVEKKNSQQCMKPLMRFECSLSSFAKLLRSRFHFLFCWYYTQFTTGIILQTLQKMSKNFVCWWNLFSIYYCTYYDVPHKNIQDNFNFLAEQKCMYFLMNWWSIMLLEILLVF